MRKLILSALCIAACALPAIAAADTMSQGHPADMLVTTTPTLEGYTIKEYRGIVRGVTVRQPTIGQGLAAGFERLKGGHIGAYTAMCDTTRQQAYDLCLDKARTLGANAIVGMRYDSSGFEHGDNVATEVICYGTAVTVEQTNKVSQSSAKVQLVATSDSPSTPKKSSTPIAEESSED